MAYTPHQFPLLSLVHIFSIILIITQVTIATRQVPNAAKDTEMKHPETFLDGEGGLQIPGIGQVTLPNILGGIVGDESTAAAGGMQGRYIPGLDDTFVPNAGLEIPNPFVAATVHPSAKAADAP